MTGKPKHRYEYAAYKASEVGRVAEPFDGRATITTRPRSWSISVGDDLNMVQLARVPDQL